MVRIFLIGCAVLLLVVGCAGVGSEASKKEEQGSSPKATASEEARCEGTRTIKMKSRYSGYSSPQRKVVFTTNDLPGCPKGGLLSGTDKPDKLYGGAGDDEIRGLGAKDQLIGGLGDDVIYGGPGGDSLRDYVSSEPAGGDDELYGGAGNDELEAEKGEDVLYSGDGRDLISASTDGQPEKLYCGKGKDQYYSDDKHDYVDSSCEFYSVE